MRIEAFLEQSPMFCVSLTARRFEALTSRLLEEDGLNFLEGLILSSLFFEGSPNIRPSQLAETFGTTRGNVSHCISSLESKSLVRRKVDPDDARVFHLTLRPQGRKAAMRVIGVFDKTQQKFEKEVGKEALQASLRVIRLLGERCEQ